MSKILRPKIIAVIGPTASGKSDVAVDIALFIQKNSGRFGVSGAEIISADSRQIYKWMDIGSNKITKEEMESVPHHLLSVASPKNTFTVAQYQKSAQKAIKQITDNNNIAILCGGTGLYIDSVVFGNIFPKIKPNSKLRKKLEKMTTENLFAMLSKKDPQRAETIDRFNRRRLVRALEIVIVSGKPVPKIKTEEKFDVLWIGLKTGKQEIKKQIESRTQKRLDSGMIQEVKNLHAKHGLSWKKLESFGLEYGLIAQFLQGKISREEMIDKINLESLRYSKRQMTWFKRNKNINWFYKKQLPAIKQAVKKFFKN